MTQKDQVEQLVEMLDSFMEGGGGHMNITVEQSCEDLIPQIDIYKSLDCSKNPMACAVPTLHQGIDEEKTTKKE